MKIKKLIKKRVQSLIVNSLRDFVTDKQEEMLRGISRLQSIAYLHQQTFAKYRGIYQGKDVVLIGGGPSVKNFIPIDNCVYVGLNRACLLKNISFDYLFTIDKIGTDKIYSEFGNYNCVKFVGDQNLGPSFQIPESQIIQMTNVYRYKTDAGLYRESHFTVDIATEPLGNFNTVSLQAMQFILYTNPRRVYLVGIDCSSAGHFDEKQGNKVEHYGRMQQRGENIELMVKDYLRYWYQFKDFLNQYYPETEIVSVNPVGLRGLFTDLDQ